MFCHHTVCTLSFILGEEYEKYSNVRIWYGIMDNSRTIWVSRLIRDHCCSKARRILQTVHLNATLDSFPQRNDPDICRVEYDMQQEYRDCSAALSNPLPSSSITSLICPTVCATIIPNCIIATGDLYHGEVSSIAEYYLHNSRTSFILDTRETVYLGNISAIGFSLRLGQSKNPSLLGTQVSSIISVTPACLPLSAKPLHH